MKQDSYAQHLAVQGLSNNTISTYLEFIPQEWEAGITKSTYKTWLAMRSNQNPVARAALKHYLQYKGYKITPPPLRKTKRRNTIKSIGKEDCELLIKKSSGRLKLGLLLMYECGFRISELINLQVKQINTYAQHIIYKGKGDQTHTVRLTKRARKWLRTVLQDCDEEYHPFRFEGVKIECQRQKWYREIKRLGKKVLKTHISPHSLRHSHGQVMYDQGVPLEIIQRDMNHSHISTTQVYAQASSAAVNDARKKVFG